MEIHIFSTLLIKWPVLHRARRHLKFRVDHLFVYVKLLIKKLPVSLSRLNDINEGCEKKVPVSGSF
mgnify:CR=1 FL=1